MTNDHIRLQRDGHDNARPGHRLPKFCCAATLTIALLVTGSARVSQAQMPAELAGLRMPRIKYAPATYADIRRRSAEFDTAVANHAGAASPEADKVILSINAAKASASEIAKALEGAIGRHAEQLREVIEANADSGAIALQVMQANLAAAGGDAGVQRVAFVCYDLRPLGGVASRTFESYVSHEALIGANVNADNIAAWESLLIFPALSAMPEADPVRVRFAGAAAIAAFARQQKSQTPARTVAVIDAALNNGEKLEPHEPQIKERMLDRLVSALEAIGTPAALDVLMRAFSHDSEAVRHAAASAAGNSPVENRLAALRSGLASAADERAREAYQQAIAVAQRKSSAKSQ